MTQQSQPHPSKNNLANSDDEIDLLGLFKSLLKTWKTWALSIIVVSAIFGGYTSLQILFSAPEPTYSKPIRLTFPNVHKLIFPSGAKFSYSDIVAPAVVQTVHKRNNLDEYGVTVADLQRGLSSTPYAPTYPLIVERYNKLLNDKKLTPDLIANLQQQLEKEIEQAISGEALISLRLDKKELPKDVAAKVLNDIPAIWAERSMKEKGVLSINAQLATKNSLNVDLIKQEEALVVGDLLNEKLLILEENIEKLSSFEGTQSITDPITGMRLTDLSFAANDLSNYVIRHLLAPVQLQGLSNTPKSSTYYYTDKLNKLSVKLSGLEKQAAAIKTVSDSYSRFEYTSRGNANGQSNSPNVVPQLSADVLDKLVSLSGDIEREKYKQTLNSQWLKLTREITETESAIADAQMILSALQKGTSDSGISASQKEHLEKVKLMLPEILEKLSGYFDVSERIYRQLSIESVGIIDQLYVPITNSILIKKSTIDIKSTILTWLALMFLTTVIVVPTCMIRNALKEKPTI